MIVKARQSNEVKMVPRASHPDDSTGAASSSPPAEEKATPVGGATTNATNSAALGTPQAVCPPVVTGAYPPAEGGSPVLPVAARYQGAWGEASARIQSRQLVNLQFAVAVLATGALVVGLLRDGEPQNWAPILSFGLVALTWMYCLWIRHNDAILGLLGAFMRQCELLDDRCNTTGVPA